MDVPAIVFWFRRDLRLYDNAGLYHALKSGYPVIPIFIFDKDILDKLEDRNDARVTFIYEAIIQLDHELKKLGSSLIVLYNTPENAFKQIITLYPNIKKVYANHDYESYARKRDAEISQLLTSKGIDFLTFKDQCIMEKDEVIKDDGRPYTVFTPYKNKWMHNAKSFYLKSYPTETYTQSFVKSSDLEDSLPTTISLKEMGFIKSNISFPSKEYQNILNEYALKRDIPSIKGTSQIGVHLRFGTISIRELARAGKLESETWLNELIWRDFYFMILWHFPYVEKRSFKSDYDKIPWRNNEEEFELWCEGKTGYPIVDAGMRELNATGFMHNRIRMIVASFLTKHLLIDWRWGEAYFARKLLDFELSSNNGGWQWAAGSGCDAAPYFRIFNPYEQTRKFDPDFNYIRKWVPEFQELTYPKPIVEHTFARERCLQVYKKALLK